MSVWDDIDRAIAAHLPEFAAPFVLTLRPGYVLADGRPTTAPAGVVLVAGDPATAATQLPKALAGYPLDVRTATDLKAYQLADPAAYERNKLHLRSEQVLPAFPTERRPNGSFIADGVASAAAAAKTQIPYTAPAGASLAPVTDTFTVVAHASPDAGWPVLQPFLAGTQRSLAVAMYDFTSAHILSALETSLAEREFSLVLDHPAPNPTSDQTDEQTHAALVTSLGSKLAFAWALTDGDPFAAAYIFPTAYHIKVAVRDGASFWLSSGNWNNSNQPAIDPVDDPATGASIAQTSDRDWHAIVTHPGLTRTFATFLANDLTVATAHQSAAAAAASLVPGSAGAEIVAAAASPAAATPPYAQFFAPQTFTDTMTVTPLLTPDPGDYASAILALIEAATRTFYMQTQYIHVSSAAADAAFSALITAVGGLQRRGLDVRIIMSEYETAEYLEQLQSAGIDLAGVRIQNNVHNKGIVVDTQIAVVSSQNWSADGVLRNRDAGLIVAHPGVAAYYERLFLHDWANLAKEAGSLQGALRRGG